MADDTKADAKYNITINVAYSTRGSDTGFDLSSLFGGNGTGARAANGGYDSRYGEDKRGYGSRAGRGLPAREDMFQKYLKETGNKCPLCHQGLHAHGENGATSGVNYDR
jgi:hypothetical protein